MDTLQAAYRDVDDEIDESSTPPPAHAAVEEVAPTTATLDSPPAAAESDMQPDSNQVNEIKDEPRTLSLEFELPSSDGTLKSSDSNENDQINPQNSSNLPPETDGDEEEDAEEEQQHPSKKQRQLTDLPKPEPSDVEITETPSPGGEQITSLPQNGKPAATGTAKTSSKKSKKKSKDVWVTTSRKGKKKTKHASNSDQNGQEDRVFIAPVPRFPDRNDDSPDLKTCLSKINKAEKVELSEDRLTAGSIKGYRMVRATRGVTEGAWYFEIKVMHLGETGHTRLGWSTEKADLQAPVGFDVNSFGYRDIDGSKVHKAVRVQYGEEGYKKGDVLGFYINLPDGESYAPDVSSMVWYKGQRYASSSTDAKEDDPKVVPGSEITYYKNGICQGVAFRDIYGGRYYPAASMYTLPNQPNCVVKFNFGPDFEMLPEDFGERPVPRPMIEVPYQCYDGRFENGNLWNITRMCPMLKVMKEEDAKILKCC